MNASFHGRRMFLVLYSFTVALSINLIFSPVRTSSLKTPLSATSDLDLDFENEHFNNDETNLSPPYRRFFQGNADGYFENYITSWSLPNFDENVINMEMIIDITLTSGALNAFSARLYNKNFGKLDTVQAFLFNTGSNSFDSIAIDRSRNIDGAITVRSLFGVIKRGGDTFRLKYVYNVTGGVCIRDGRQGIDGTWASLYPVTTNNIEYDFILGDVDVASVNLDTFFTPKTKRFTETEGNSSYSIYISYKEDDLNFGEAAPEVVFFGWKTNLFSIFFSRRFG